MCCSSCHDTSEPSEIPSSTSTVWVRIGGTASGRPAIAAMPTAIMAPEINPPGRFAHRNSTPPAVPMTSVSSALRILARLGIANAIDAGIRLTPPYGKSPHRRQMRPRTAAMRIGSFLSSPTRGQGRRSLRLFSRGLLAFGTEFLALLAVQPLGVGLLRAFERGRGARFLGFLFRRCHFRRRRRRWRGGRGRRGGFPARRTYPPHGSGRGRRPAGRYFKTPEPPRFE